MLENDGEDQSNGSCEKRKSITQNRKRKNVRHTIKRSKANWIGNILYTNCRLKQIAEEKVQGTKRPGRRRKQLVSDVKEKRRYWNFKEEASISAAATGRLSAKFDFGTYM